jgi:hypothetical protein
MFNKKLYQMYDHDNEEARRLESKSEKRSYSLMYLILLHISYQISLE